MNSQAPAGNTPLIVVIDGLSFLFRAFHAVRHTLTRSDGTPVNALFGFSQMLQKVIEDLQPQYCVVALDSKGPTFRHDMYLEYKANRDEPAAEILTQIPMMPALINAFGVAHHQCEGCEADDIIASIVLKSKAEFGPDVRVAIVSSDKDLNALVGGNVKLWDTMKDKWLGPAEVIEKFGVSPAQIPEILALMGDASDNVPGVRGIGPKTAAGLIQQFDTIDEIYRRIDEVKNERIRNLLKEHEADARLSRKLVQLKGDMDLPDMQTFEFKPDLPHAVKFLREEMEFNTLAARLEKRAQKQASAGVAQVMLDRRSGDAEVSKNDPAMSQSDAPVMRSGTPWGPYACITTPDAWKNVLSEISKTKTVAFDTETTSLNPYRAKLVGISLAVPGGTVCYVPLQHVDPDSVASSDGGVNLFDAGAKRPDQLAYKDVLADLMKLLADPAIKKIGHNLKYDWLVVAHAAGITPKDTGEKLQTMLVNYEDTMLLSACLDAGRWQHGLDDLAVRHLGHVMIKYEDVCGKGKAQVTFDRVPLDKATEYAAEDADATLRLWDLLGARLKDLPQGDYGPAYVYEGIEKKLLPVVIAMEARGVRVDVQALRGLADQFAHRLGELEQDIFRIAGHDFNVASPAQLGVVLFDELKLGTPAQQKKRGTGVDILGDLLEAEIAVAGPAVGLLQGVMEFRTLSKLRGTYAETLPEEVSPLTHRIHTSYQQIGAGTGRFSSTEPNLQNIPIRTAEGRKIRQAFVPQAGWKMLSADYAQIELRLLAHFSGSPGLVEAFARGDDIHAATAASIFGKDLKDVTKEERRSAKAVNFGLVYGMGANSLAAQANVSRHEAAEWMAAYFQRYDGVRDYMEANKKFARDNGYVETLCGRRVWLPGITSPNGGIRSNSERAAINAPLQGSNADVIKLAMPQVEKLLTGMPAQMLMQVHDELVLEAHPDVVEELKQKLPAVMAGVVKLRVPLTVEVGVGSNWDEAH
ncbi:MAG TPA: DNA polymerase I [Alphaproteobacteria bacterium]|nr:DNA polymerase I [Alphaproteobacteria bacterium]